MNSFAQATQLPSEPTIQSDKSCWVFLASTLTVNMHTANHHTIPSNYDKEPQMHLFKWFVKYLSPQK